MPRNTAVSNYCVFTGHLAAKFVLKVYVKENYSKEK